MSTEPLPTRRPSGVVTGLLVAAVLGLWLLLWGELLVGIPRAKRAFDEYGLKLPEVTRAAIGFGTWVSTNAVLVLPPAIVGGVAAGCLIGAFRHRPRWARLVNVLAAIALAALVTANVVLVGAMAIPAIKLQEGLNK